MMLKRISAAVLAAMMLCPLLAACSDSADDPLDSLESGTSTDTTTAEPVETSVQDIPDGLPEKMDYAGAKYTIMIVNEAHRLTYRFDLTPEEVGDTLDQAAYNRTETVENRFNVDIVTDPTGTGGGAEFAYLQQCAQAGDHDVIDLVIPNGGGYGKAATAVLNNLLMDWNDLKMIDLDKPWWDKESTEKLSLHGGIYIVSGAITTTRDGVQGMIFNKALMDDIGAEYPYASASAGTWTVDEMMELAAKATKDLNGDGTMDQTDRYGLVTHETLLSKYQSYWGAGDVLRANKDGTLYVDYDADLLQNIAEKVLSMISSGNVFYFPASDNDSPFAMFQKGLGLFHMFTLGQSYAWLRDIDGFDYGILPIPKYTAEQESYNNFSVTSILCIFSQVENPERTGNITEALCAETLKQVYDPFVKVMLSGKIAQDPRDVEMIDLVWESKCVELVRIYSTNTFFVNLIRNVVTTRSPDVQSIIAAKLPTLQAVLDDFNKQITTIDKGEN